MCKMMFIFTIYNEILNLHFCHSYIYEKNCHGILIQLKYQPSFVHLEQMQREQSVTVNTKVFQCNVLDTHNLRYSVDDLNYALWLM